MEKEFEKFCKVVIEQKLYENPKSYFVGICNSLNIEPRALNEYIMSEFGVDGDEMLNRLYHQNIG